MRRPITRCTGELVLPNLVKERFFTLCEELLDGQFAL